MAFKAGFKSAGVMISSTKEVTILPNAPPITTPTAKSTTLPFTANSLNSLKKSHKFKFISKFIIILRLIGI